MIQLFDTYNQESQDLHASLKAAGFSCPTVIIEPNGFLPAGFLSPFTYFLDKSKEKKAALFFNQVPVPPYWEITGDNQAAKVSCLGEEKARIHYADNSSSRLVKQVDWLDKKGGIRYADHYDKYGSRFAQTIYSSEQVAITTTYFSADNQERIVENHQTGDVILTLEHEPSRFFKSRVEFLIFFLEWLNLDLDHILFNSLSTSFLLSYALPKGAGQDILVWQEPIYDEIPGNMSLILENHHLRAQKIIIPDKETYEQAKSLLPEEYHEKLLPLGYHYDFKRDNFLRPTAMVLTHSDQIEHLEDLVQTLPEVTFRIAALTEMSPKLLSMLTYKNVVLYQNASLAQITDIFQQSDLYLDINHGGEVLHANRQAFEHNLLILAFEETLHDRRYVASSNTFASAQLADFVARIRFALADVTGMREALLAQGHQANDVPLEVLQETLSDLLGGAHD